MKKILIAEDEQNIACAVEFLMRQENYEVRLSCDGADTLQQIAAYQPDLLLLDIMLPSINGYEVCRQIRSQPQWNSMKIIMLTAKGRESEVRQGLVLGADAYVTKPFSTHELIATVKSLIA